MPHKLHMPPNAKSSISTLPVCI